MNGVLCREYKEMKLKKLTYRIILGVTVSLFSLTACTSQNELPALNPEQEKHGMPIRWNVIPEGMQEGRALIHSTANLQTACSSGGQAIGIWSAYRIGNDLIEGILSKDKEDVGLYWQSIQNNYEWTYGESAYWTDGATYYFNAYFPMEGGLNSITNTETTITGNYNTETTQTDVMVAKVVVGADAHGSPVELPLKHTLATLQFKFQMEEGSTTENVLTSFSLDKTLRTSANLNYGGGAMTIDNWKNKTASANPRIYAQTLNPGLPFSATTAVNPYAGNENDGHILIIPQSCIEAPTFSCTIDAHTYENISLGTKLFEPGKNYIYLIKMKDNILNVTLRIKAWNELDSSYDIIF